MSDTNSVGQAVALENPDPVVSIGDEQSEHAKDWFEEEEEKVGGMFTKRPEPPPIVYPLSLSREECLALFECAVQGKIYWRGRGEEYFRDTGNEYELVEEVNKHLWNKRALDSVLSGGFCPVCYRDETRRLIYRGTKTNFFFVEYQSCFCVKAKRFFGVLEKIPLRFRDFKLRDLTACSESILSPAFQLKEIEFLRAHETESFTFLGPPGTSKSTFASALIRKAMGRLAEDRRGEFAVWVIDAGHFIESETAFACADFEDRAGWKHDVTIDDIHRAARNGNRPVMLIEELDKRKPTDFNTDLMGRVVNAMYENKGQLIVTSNLSRQGLTDFYLKATDKQARVAGGALLRRLLSPEVNVRDYFNA